MKTLQKPWWIFLTISIPQVILFLIYLGTFKIIKTLLPEESLMLWKSYAIILIASNLLFTGFAVFQLIRRKSLPLFFGILIAAFHVILLYFLTYHGEDLIPWDIPGWMLPSADMIIYPFTFLMPAIAYGVFATVVRLTPKTDGRNILVSILSTIGIPIICFLGITVIGKGIRWYNMPEFWEHAITVVFVMLALIFVFSLIRSIYMITSNKSAFLRKYSMLWKLPFVLIFPIIGLLINNGAFQNDPYSVGSYIFGDFSSIWFYILAALTGIAMLIPKLKNTNISLALFVARSILFCFTFYFFIVFLPFLPLSIFAVIAAGAGFLMLAPLVLMIIHSKELKNDYIFLKQYFSKALLRSILIGGFLCIPILITISYLSDKSHINKALNYVYDTDLSQIDEININPKSVLRSLNSISQRKDFEGGRNFAFEETTTPYLAPYYNWLVLDNMTLSDKKIAQISSVFTSDSEEVPTRFDNRWTLSLPPNNDTQIDSLFTETVYHNESAYYSTWIHFEIENNGSWNQEYFTRFELPDGCWISDYYLDVLGERKYGILVEESAAKWVYQQITSANRDPGLLYYQGFNSIVFRVFPILKDESSKTGIQIMHKEPVDFSIDDYTFSLGNDSINTKATLGIYQKDGVMYFSKNEKEELPTVQRTPYFCFLLDNSNPDDLNTYLEQAKGVNTTFEKQFYAVNHTIKKLDLSKSLNNTKKESGYFVELAIKKILYDNYLSGENTYPVFVLITDTSNNLEYINGLDEYSFLDPEKSDAYLFLNKNSFKPISLRNESKLKTDILETPITDKFVKLYETKSDKPIYLRNDNEPEIVLLDPNDNISITEIKGQNWEAGLQLEAQRLRSLIHNEEANDNWVALIKNSFSTGIMNASTSFIVVENEAQEAALLDKQKQTLNGNKNLDINEDIHQMSEPGLWIVFLIALLSLGLIKYRKRKASF